MEKVQWKVEGMTCTNCALTINKYLEKQGARNVSVNASDGDVSFESSTDTGKLRKGIEELGYTVSADGELVQNEKKKWLSTNMQRFWFCLPFTILLMLHMFPALHIHWLMNPWIQLGLTIPVFLVGMRYFGRSAVKSLRNGVPNMNVLITLGALSAFIYSLIGAVGGLGDDYLFFETTATIITLVFLGNYLEDVSVETTQRSLKALVKSQKVMANMIAFDNEYREQIFEVENSQLRVGDLVLIRTGEQVPADCKILWGEAQVNESILTGESLPVFKTKKDTIIGGSIVEDGSLKAQVTAVGGDTVLSSILSMVKKAQGEKPPVQQMADRISAIFVPVVVGIAVITLVANWMILGEFSAALMRSIAVLVIACPCAMGLATPAAIAVGLGRGARSGILFRNAKSLELFREIKQVVFDKTGTLTTGNFKIGNFQPKDITAEEFQRVVYSMEKFSNHPLARVIVRDWKVGNEIKWKSINEIKGQGMKGEDADGNRYFAGSHAAVKQFEVGHSIYVTRNDELIGWIDLQDEIRKETQMVIDTLKRQGVKTILLTGDSIEKARQVASALNIDEVIAEQTPEEKLEKIAALTKEQPTVMVGDGINDAPALAKATIGISMSDASHMAMQSAQVVLMNSGLKKLPTALGLGKHTFLTIKQNLFWAFAYNVVAIPVAALGFMHPGFAALVMGFSDVVLAINSVRLNVKKLV
jgi:Cu+-exporting ATPase